MSKTEGDAWGRGSGLCCLAPVSQGAAILGFRLLVGTGAGGNLRTAVQEQPGRQRGQERDGTSLGLPSP